MNWSKKVTAWLEQTNFIDLKDFVFGELWMTLISLLAAMELYNYFELDSEGREPPLDKCIPQSLFSWIHENSVTRSVLAATQSTNLVSCLGSSWGGPWYEASTYYTVVL